MGETLSVRFELKGLIAGLVSLYFKLALLIEEVILTGERVLLTYVTILDAISVLSYSNISSLYC